MRVVILTLLFTACVVRIKYNSVQSLSCVRLFVTPWTAAHQASLSITNSRGLPKLMSIESVMPSNHLVLCHLLLLLPSVFPRIRVFSSESALCIRWPQFWSFSFSISQQALSMPRFPWMQPKPGESLCRDPTPGGPARAFCLT